MNGIRVSLPILLAGLVLGGPVAAHSAAVDGNGSGAARGGSQVNAAASAEAPAPADLAAAREKITRKASEVARRTREKADARLEATAQKVDAEAKKNAAAVQGRLAGEFETTTEVLAAQRAELGASWGELMVAHSLEQN